MKKNNIIINIFSLLGLHMSTATSIRTLDKLEKPLDYKVQISKFVQESPKSAFTNLGLNPNKFVLELRDRIEAPWKINQGAASLCGPNAFMTCVAARHPNAYASYLIQLWKHGEAYLGGLKVTPSAKCLSASVVSSSGGKGEAIRAIDWMALASLRDSSNKFFNYDHFSDQMGGITLPESLAGWFKSTLFGSAVNKTSISSPRSIENLQSAQREFTANKSVCLFISTKVTKGSFKIQATPNHWVVLSQPIKLDGKPLHSYTLSQLEENIDKPIEVYVMTWGYPNGRYPLHGRHSQKTLSLKDFLNFYYGFVAA